MEAPPNEPQKLHLLVAEDEDALREILVQSIKGKNIVVFDAHDGNSAFEIVKNHRIDFVISDIRMPGGDGLSLLKNIQALPGSKPKVILMTGFADIDRDGALRLGAIEILAKPFSRQKLVDLILANK